MTRPGSIPSPGDGDGDTVFVDGRTLSCADVVAVARHGAEVAMAAEVTPRLTHERAVVDDVVERQIPAYGVTTGLGSRSSYALPREELAEFSVRTVRGRANAVGDPLLGRGRAGRHPRADQRYGGRRKRRPAGGCAATCEHAQRESAPGRAGGGLHRLLGPVTDGPCRSRRHRRGARRDVRRDPRRCHRTTTRRPESRRSRPQGRAGAVRREPARGGPWRAHAATTR